jgi:hypothetical protein
LSQFGPKWLRRFLTSGCTFLPTGQLVGEDEGGNLNFGKPGFEKMKTDGPAILRPFFEHGHPFFLGP